MLKIVLWMTDHMFYLGCTWHTPYPESVSLNIRFGMKSRNRAAVLISGSSVQHLLARCMRTAAAFARKISVSLIFCEKVFSAVIVGPSAGESSFPSVTPPAVRGCTYMTSAIFWKFQDPLPLPAFRSVESIYLILGHPLPIPSRTLNKNAPSSHAEGAGTETVATAASSLEK